MIKNFLYMILICLFFFSNAVYAGENNNNYFVENKNYYNNNSFHKGYLENKVGPIPNPKDNNDVNLSYFEFYLKYGMSPEDTSVNAPNSTHNSSEFQQNNNAPIAYNWLPFNWVSNMRPNKDDNNYIEQIGSRPAFYSQLYVGDNKEGITNNQKYDGDIPTDNQTGFSSENNLHDSMLNKTNDFLIPTRYNEQRNDIMLSMRSRSDYNIIWPEVDLSVKGEDGLNLDTTKGTTLKYRASINYINQMWTGISFSSKIVLTSINNKIKNEWNDINKFNEKINSNFDTLYKQAIKNVNLNGIPGGIGAKVNISGFTRSNDDIKQAQWSILYPRKKSELINVDYNLYQGVKSINKEYTSGRSYFGIEVTRPVISDSKNNQNISFNQSSKLSEYSKLLDVDIIDTGVFNDNKKAMQFNKIAGDSIGVNKETNLRVALYSIKDTGEIKNKIIESSTISDMANKLFKYSESISKYALVYTYSGVDTIGIVGKLPSEINDNEGAYAIPYVKIVSKTASKSKVVIKHLDESNNKLSDEEVITNYIGSKYITSSKKIKGYTLKNVPANEKGVHTNYDIEVKYIYSKDMITNNLPDNGNYSLKIFIIPLIILVIGITYTINTKLIDKREVRR